MNKHEAGSRAGKIGLLPRALVSRQWWWTTLLVLAGMVLLFRLGIWQLDRLDQRRAKNAQLQTQLDAPPLFLNELENLTQELPPNRQVTAAGEFDFSQQMLLKLQNYNGRQGGHLLAPLLLAGRDVAVLVDRGWLPEVELPPERWAQLDEPGLLEITGYVQATQLRPENSATEADAAQLEWYRVDVAAISAQLPYELLPYYVLQAPYDQEGFEVSLPARETPDFDLSEGSHLSYALQWFAFTLMLGGGYLYFVYRQL